MKKFSHFLILFIFALVSILACKKTDLADAPSQVGTNLPKLEQGFKTYSWSPREQDFFRLHRKTSQSPQRDDYEPRGFYHPLLVEAYNEIAESNSQHHFVDSLASLGGFPLWESAMIAKDASSNSDVVCIPLSVSGSNEVSSYIVLHKVGNQDFVVSGVTRPNMLNTSKGDPRVKDNYARIMAGFDNRIFKSRSQQLADAICSYSTRRDSIESSSGGSTAPPTPPLVFCHYLPVNICTNNGVLFWNSFLGVLPLHLDHDLDGIPNEDDPEWRDMVEQTGVTQNQYEQRVRQWWEENMEEEHGDYDDFWDYDFSYYFEGGSNVDLSDLFDSIHDIFEGLGQDLGDLWDDFNDWWDDLWDGDVRCPEWPVDGVVTDRDIICGVVYLPLCNDGTHDDQMSWWIEMINEIQSYVHPNGPGGTYDLRDYVGEYRTENSLEDLIDFWDLLDIVDGVNGVNGVNGCYPQGGGGFTACVDDMLLGHISNNLTISTGLSLNQGQIEFLQNDRGMLNVVASFVYNNHVNNPSGLVVIPDVISINGS
jgi:hypothetical protein